MTSRGVLSYSWWWGLAGAFTALRTILGFPDVAVAQIVPDTTLGAESSTVTRDILIQGIVSDAQGQAPTGLRIDSGAIRGTNLFHSFEQFNIDAQRGAYFSNPTGIENIFSRVTGNEPSNILGRLGVLGNANLFLLNPNGILFGPNASLDVQGSFVGTTANAIEFGLQGFFSATNPQAPPLLTINPSALLFTQLNPGAIAVQSRIQSDNGLIVPVEKSLLLVGGNVTLDGGQLYAPSGRIELGGLAGTGTVGLTTNGNALQLNFPTDAPRADVVLQNDAIAAVWSDGGGDIAVNAKNLTLLNRSGIASGFLEGQGAVDRRSGNVVVNATGTVSVADSSIITNGSSNNSVGNLGDVSITAATIDLTNNSFITNSHYGQGNTGQVNLSVAGGISLDAKSAILNSAEAPTGIGNDIFVTAKTINLTNTSRISTNGRGGDVKLNVADTLSLRDGSDISTFSLDKIADSGDIAIAARSLDLRNNAGISTASSGQGNSGNISLTAKDTIALSGSGSLSSSVISLDDQPLLGRGGNIQIETGTLSLTDPFTSIVAQSIGGTSAGDIQITATDSIRLNDFVAISSSSNRGDGGNIQIQTRSLSLLNGAVINTLASGQGNSGNLTITASDSIKVVGEASEPIVIANYGLLFPTSNIDTSNYGFGNGGQLTINTGRLTVRDGATITMGIGSNSSGRSGDLVINAVDSVEVVGETRDGQIRSYLGANTNGFGNAGNIEINTRRLSVRDGAFISTFTSLPNSTSRAGDITINARDSVEISGRSRNGQGRSSLDSFTVNDGNAGRITLDTGSLSLIDGGRLSATTSGQGNAGNISINARDRVVISGGIITSGVNQQGSGQGGDIRISTGSLSLLSGGLLFTETFGQNNAGNITIDARDRIVVDGSNQGTAFTGITSSVGETGNGRGGDIRITTNSLLLSNGGSVFAETSGQGRAGNILVEALDRIEIDDNTFNDSFTGISSSVINPSPDQIANGRGGNIDITTGSLLISNGTGVVASTNGQGDAGDITIVARDRVSLDGVDQFGFSSRIGASTLEGARGNGGRITIDTNSLQIANGANIVARTLNPNPGGNVTINANTFDAINGGQIITSTYSSGQAGNITLNANRVNLSGIDPNYTQRLEQFGSLVVPNQSAGSGLYANTTSDTSGIGGTIRVNASELNLFDRAQISSSSRGTGTAGGIVISANQAVTLNNSDITTAAEQASGGEISITANTIRLYEDSDIRTNVESGINNGGNITLRANSIIALGDSDILAFARDGRGGTITLDTPAFFGENYKAAPVGTNLNSLDGNDRVDINATGAISSGNIFLPDVSFIQNNLTELVQNPIDTNALIANSCIARSDRFEGSFVITGADSLPYHPGNAVVSYYPTGDVRHVQGDNVSRSWQKGDPIVEPQGVYQLPDGRLVLSRECS